MQQAPVKKCRFCSSEGEGFRFAGAISVIMTYYKLHDTISDSGFFKRTLARSLMGIMKHCYKKAEKAYPEIAKAVGEAMAYQQQAESSDSGIDAASDPTAKLLSWLCESLSEVKHNSFNPFRKELKDDISETMRYCNEVLNMTAAQLMLAYDLLDLNSYKEILDNVVYYGLSFQQKHCLFDKKTSKKSRKKDKDHYAYLANGEKRS